MCETIFILGFFSLLLDDNYLNLRLLPWPKEFEIPVHKFSEDLKRALITGNVTWGQKYELMTHLASVIVQYTENPTAHQRNQVAEVLIEAFPQLKCTVGESNHSTISLWSTRIHDKMREIRRKKRSKCSGLFVDKNVDVYKRPKIQHLQTRGLINWCPPPPAGEDDMTMSNHKEWLKCEFRKINAFQDPNEISRMMELCFSYRRKEINSNVSLNYLKSEYPFMFTTDGILKEFLLLMIIDAENTFMNNARLIARNLIKFAEERKKLPEDMHNILKMFSLIPYIEKKPNDEVITSLLILPYLFLENSDFMYKSYPADTPMQDIVTGPATPHVAVVGNPVTSSKVFVVAENEILIECYDFVQAVVACMAVYYCCNIKYPDEANHVYYFMQMQLLKLEHHGKKLPRKVITLVEKIKNY